ncbi:MAG: adenosine deaminase family protein [Acidimicrobiales bacterium]
MAAKQTISRQALKRLPKVVLHDHLDGGLRPATILDLAQQQGYADLPTSDTLELADWFHQRGVGSLERYLRSFSHTIAVTQTVENLERVAFEAGIDLWDDGVRYAEVRFAPSLHTRHGLAREDVIEAVLEGFTRAAYSTGIYLNGIAVAMRDDTDSEEVARAAIQFVDQGLVAFDLAGPEGGFPARAHQSACRIARAGGLGLTIHGGEGHGPESMAQAILHCSADRIGHGVRIVEDLSPGEGVKIKVSPAGATGGSGFRFDYLDIQDVELGHTARVVRDHRVPLEVCPKSNADTGATAGAAQHPLGLLVRLGFRVTLNTDNRLMSNVSMTDEFENAVVNHGFGTRQLLEVTEAAITAGFGDWSDRIRLLNDVIRPAYGVA